MKKWYELSKKYAWLILLCVGVIVGWILKSRRYNQDTKLNDKLTEVVKDVENMHGKPNLVTSSLDSLFGSGRGK